MASEDVLVADRRAHDAPAGAPRRRVRQAAVGEHADHDGRGRPARRVPGGRARARRSAGHRRPPRPRSSTTTHRSASPSRAKPTSAPVSRTTPASAAGAVAPQPTLMLTPSGRSKSVSTVAPGGGQDLRRDGAGRAVGAVEHDAQAGADRSGELQPVGAVVLEQAAAIDLAAEALVARPGELVGAPDERLELVLDRVVQLQAALVEHLEAVVVGAGLCDAETMMPAANRPGPPGRTRGRAWAARPRGARRRPWTVAPATRAAVSMSPDRRVS